MARQPLDLILFSKVTFPLNSPAVNLWNRILIFLGRELYSCVAQDKMPLEGEDPHLEEEMYREKNKRGMTEEEVSLLLFQTLEGIIEDLKEKGRENSRNFQRGFMDKSSPSCDHVGCENLATHADPQCSTFPTSNAGRMEEEESPREETLSDFLWEYESQSWRFEVHLEFQEFCRLKGARSSREKGRYILSIHFRWINKVKSQSLGGGA